jgi:hypothetical protein
MEDLYSTPARFDWIFESAPAVGEIHAGFGHTLADYSDEGTMIHFDSSGKSFGSGSRVAKFLGENFAEFRRLLRNHESYPRVAVSFLGPQRKPFLLNPQERKR